ncbi:MAG TPA: response regulator [Terriglobales bacterium]|nr:response regulator [Terriglobales bacterium]
MGSAATGLAKDPSEQKSLQGVLLAYRAELLGGLAGAIAHRFNNIMMAVSSYAEVELKRATPQQKRNLEQVLSNVGQATSLVQKLITLSRRREPSRQPLSLNSLATGMSGLLQQLCGEGVEIVLDLGQATKAVEADHVEIESLILGLAMEIRNYLSGGGKLTLSTNLRQLDRSFFEADEAAAPGWYVLICVSGQRTKEGQASSKEGKDPAAASVAAARSLAKQAGALLRVSDSQNERSCTLYFAALGQAAPEEPAVNTSSRALTVARTILVVDDDDAVRVPAAEFLKMEGFKVLQAKNGPEALEIIERHNGSLDLLVTDILMPEMTGGEVAGKLQHLYPELKVLYMSGDSNTAPLAGPADPASTPLQKPFRLNRLNDMIRDLLGS